MKLTKHAQERIGHRTTLKSEDVLAMITAKACVLLGRNDKVSYLLFYSPFDMLCKIAVVTRDGAKIVSVWDSDFLLPTGIPRPGKRARRQARALYDAYAQERKAESLPDMEPVPRVIPDGPYFSAKIEVRVNRGTIYTHEIGTLTHAEGITRATCLEKIRPEIMRIAREVEGYKEKLEGPVRYHVILKPIKFTRMWKGYSVPHRRVVKWLEAYDLKAAR